MKVRVLLHLSVPRNLTYHWIYLVAALSTPKTIEIGEWKMRCWWRLEEMEKQEKQSKKWAKAPAVIRWIDIIDLQFTWWVYLIKLGDWLDGAEIQIDFQLSTLPVVYHPVAVGVDRVNYYRKTYSGQEWKKERKKDNGHLLIYLPTLPRRRTREFNLHWRWIIISRRLISSVLEFPEIFQ